MVLFSIFSVLTLLAIFLVLPTALKGVASKEKDNKQLNVEVARERLKVLEQELESGKITKDEYDISYQDIQNNLLFDLEVKDRDSHNVNLTQRLWSIGLTAVALPLLAGVLYLNIGNPGAINPAVVSAAPSLEESKLAGGEKLPSVEKMVELLKTRLQDNPENKQGWSILANTLMRMQRFDEAIDALTRLNELEPDNADVLVRYADAIAMKNKGELHGKAIGLVKQALKINPNQPQGLWLAGMEAAQHGQMDQALSYWRKLKPLLKDDPQLTNEIALMINRAEIELGGGTVTELDDRLVAREVDQDTEADIRLQVEVSISPELRVQLGSSDTLFVIAKENNGTPMPVAVVREPATEFPHTLILDQSSLLRGNKTLADYNQLVLKAKISRSGQAITSAGDLGSKEVIVVPRSSKTVHLVISMEL